MKSSALPHKAIYITAKSPVTLRHKALTAWWAERVNATVCSSKLQKPLKKSQLKHSFNVWWQFLWTNSIERVVIHGNKISWHLGAIHHCWGEIRPSCGGQGVIANLDTHGTGGGKGQQSTLQMEGSPWVGGCLVGKTAKAQASEHAVPYWWHGCFCSFPFQLSILISPFLSPLNSIQYKTW